MKPILWILFIMCLFCLITGEITTDEIIKSVELAKNIEALKQFLKMSD
jgi:hypothetical protein